MSKRYSQDWIHCHRRKGFKNDQASLKNDNRNINSMLELNCGSVFIRTDFKYCSGCLWSLWNLKFIDTSETSGHTGHKHKILRWKTCNFVSCTARGVNTCTCETRSTIPEWYEHYSEPFENLNIPFTERCAQEQWPMLLRNLRINIVFGFGFEKNAII